MEAFISALGDTITAIQHWSIGGTVATLSAVGVLTGALSMAFLQIMKDLTPVRRWFQEWWLERWIESRAAHFNRLTSHLKVPPPLNQSLAKKQLIELATGGEAKAFYDLPSDQMVAQMNAAAQIALDYPSVNHYYALLALVSEGADLQDVQKVAGVVSARAAVKKETLPADYTDARTRVGHRIQRNLDGLQIAMSDRWQWLLQLGAQLLCIGALEVAIYNTSTSHLGINMVVAVPIAMIAGYLAPVMRDLVAALQNLRS